MRVSGRCPRNLATEVVIHVGEHKQIDVAAAKPFNVILDPDIHLEALDNTSPANDEEGRTKLRHAFTCRSFEHRRLGAPGGVWCHDIGDR
ncbi:hypothetical protein GCM10027416_04810 [Okibacterium endophyticum]